MESKSLSVRKVNPYFNLLGYLTPQKKIKESFEGSAYNQNKGQKSEICYYTGVWPKNSNQGKTYENYSNGTPWAAYRVL